MPKHRLVNANEAVSDLLAKLTKYETALQAIAKIVPAPSTIREAVNIAREALGQDKI